jgi:hypothetical protein
VYPNSFSNLGADLSPQKQKRLEAAQTRLVVVQGKITNLNSILADSTASTAKKKQAQYWLDIRTRELAKLQSLIAKLTTAGTAPPPEETPPPAPTPAPTPSPIPTPVWTPPPSAEPISPPEPPSEQPIIEGISPGFLLLGAIALLFLFSRRATP